ncbi:MAG: NnrS family protein [Myxococcales bacterium]|nr:NnrS family protein [Myxococcales bacterium]
MADRSERLSPVLLARWCVRDVDSPDLVAHARWPTASQRLPRSDLLARPRDDLRICDGSDRRIPTHRRGELDEARDRDRPATPRSAALWALGRVVLVGPQVLPGWLIAIVDLAFLPVLLIAIARPLIATRNTRNLVMLAILAAMFVANLLVHLDVLGVLPGWRRRGCVLGLEVVVLVILVMAGRTFPMFTRNATRVDSIASSQWLDRLSIGAMAFLIALDLFMPTHAITAGWAAGAGGLTLVRTWRWGTRHTWRTPLLWILHVGYLWIPIGLVLRALAAFTSVIPPQIAMHALTVGAIGSLTLGMMARVALGHTGRLLAASPLMVGAFVLITLAAVTRVFGPLVAGMTSYRPTVFLAGSAWTAAFVLFLLACVPILIAPRVDGKPV